MLVFVLTLSWSMVSAENSVCDRVVWLCKTLREIDTRITETLRALTENGGEYVLKDILDYNAGLKRLLQFLTEHRIAILKKDEAVQFLKTSAPGYSQVNIENEKVKSSWGWLQEGVDRVYKLRAISIDIWANINKLSRLTLK